MSPTALLILRYLADAEPVLTVLALGAFLRVRRQVDLPAMRDYLVVRAVWEVVMVALLVAKPTQRVIDSYFYLYWGGSFVLAALLLRVALAALDRFLWAFRGLRAVRRIGVLWIIFVGSLLTIPVVIALAGSILHHRAPEGNWWSLRLGAAITETEFLASGSVFLAGIQAGLSPRSRMFGILAGLALDSGTSFLSAQFGSPGLWTWHNLISQIVTDSVLVLWIVYFLLPDRQGPMKEPSETLLRWDQVARWVFRDRLPAGDAEARTQEEKQHITKLR